MPPNPPSKRVASPRAAWRFAPCKFPHFSRKILNPPRNEILDTPLYVSITLEQNNITKKLILFRTMLFKIYNCVKKYFTGDQQQQSVATKAMDFYDYVMQIMFQSGY